MISFIARLVTSVSITYLILGLMLWDYNPYNWSEIWQASWYISTLQIYIFYKVDKIFNPKDYE